MNVFSRKIAISTSLTRIYHTCFYRFAQLLVRIVFGTTVRIRVTGREHLPKSGPYLLICNHISHFDPGILAAVMWRQMSWVVALDMFAHPVGDFFFTSIDSIPVDRQESDRKAVREILRRLKQGRAVGIFPEGGIRAGETSILGGQPLDENVGAIAQLGQVPIVPAFVLGTDKLYAKRNWWFRTTLDFRFGPAIPLSTDPSLDNKAVRRDITARAESALHQLAGELRTEFDLQPDDFPKTAQERWADAARIEAELKSR